MSNEGPGMSDKFCGDNQLICSGNIILEVVLALFYAFYYKQIKQKLRKQTHPLNVNFKSATFMFKVFLLTVLIVINLLGMLLILYSSQKVNLYNLVLLTTDAILFVSLGVMLRIEHRYLGYTSLEYRSLMMKILLTSQIQYMLEDLEVNSDQSLWESWVWTYVIFLSFYFGYLNIKVSNYQNSDMEKYYTRHLEKHFKSSDFGRVKEKHVHSPEIVEQATENLQMKLEKYMQESEQIKQKLLSNEEQQFTNNTGNEESFTQTHSVPCFNIQSIVDISNNKNPNFQSIFKQFEVRSTKEEYGIVTYEIGYQKNEEQNITERTFLDLFVFIKTAQKKHKTLVMRQLASVQKQNESKIENLKVQLFEEILELLQRDQEVTQEFGFFLQFENAHIWAKQFNLFLQSTLLDSFMIKSAFQHEEVEELLESEGIDLGDYWHFMKEMNSIYINNFYFKPKTQAKIEFVVQTREGRSMFQRRNISEFQKIAAQIMKEKTLSVEQGKHLKKFSEQRIEILKLELENQVNAVLRHKGPCKFKDRLYKFLIG